MAEELKQEIKKETAEEKVEKKVKKRLTPYEWRLLRKRVEDAEVRRGLKSKFSSFQREFRRQLTVFITGAFAFVAALLWRDAIKSFLNKYQEVIVYWVPIKEEWLLQTYTALAVSVVAVIAIVVISRYLKPNDE